MMKNISAFCLSIFLLCSWSLNAQTSADSKMDWWREARFGMFIHWGVYAVYGNVYDGINVKGDSIHYSWPASGYPSEWIMGSVGIPRSVYREAATAFDAKDYDPKQWVELAKNAGMKYIVITSKHHDGFCLFKTKYTDWNAVDASGAKRDLLKDLVTEAKKAGLKIGFYYSQNLDWMHEGGMGEIPELLGAEYSSEQVEKYVDNLVIPHIQELTDNYDIDLFWYDIPHASKSPSLAKKIDTALRNSRLGKTIIINDRLAEGFAGDFATRETDIPNIPYNGYTEAIDWESCGSLSNSWGYDETPDDVWKSSIYSISRLLEIASKGGNFLLNVGPDKHGNFPDGAKKTLRGIADWMQQYGETVYGTDKNELMNPFQYGYVTQRNNKDGSVKFYLHVSTGYWAKNKKIKLGGVMDLPQKAVLFNTGQLVPVELAEDGLALELPSEAPNKYYSSIELSFKKMPRQIPVPSMNEDGEIVLTPFQATSNGLCKDYVPYAFKYWYDPNATARWRVYLQPGTYTVKTEISTYDYGKILFHINNVEYEGNYPKTRKGNDPSMDNYIQLDYPEIKIDIPQKGFYFLDINRRKMPDLFNIIELRNVVLTWSAPAGLEPVNNSMLKVYPNPSTDFIFIETDTVQQVTIFSSNGLLMKRFDSNYIDRVDISTFNPGVYFIKGKNSVQKLLVN